MAFGISFVVPAVSGLMLWLLINQTTPCAFEPGDTLLYVPHEMRTVAWNVNKAFSTSSAHCNVSWPLLTLCAGLFHPLPPALLYASMQSFEICWCQDLAHSCHQITKTQTLLCASSFKECVVSLFVHTHHYIWTGVLIMTLLPRHTAVLMVTQDRMHEYIHI